MHKTLSGRLRELKRKTKEKSSWVEVAYESFSLQSLCSQFKRGFTKVVVTLKAGRLREWSQGELRLSKTRPQ